MGRPGTLPINRLHNHDRGNIKPIARSAEFALTIHVPQVHLPFKPNNSSHFQPSPTPPTRPNAILNRQNSAQTRYMTMLLALDTIPRLHNILAAFFTWILLAGFVIFPGTFTSLRSLEDTSNEAAAAIVKTVKNIPLLVIAGTCCGVGALGMLWLWWKWRDNYVWLLNRIFLPGCLNSLAGLISSLVGVYTQQRGAWSVTAKITAMVTAGCMLVTGALFGLYNFWILERVKRRHGREMEESGSVSGSEGEEGLMEKIGRKAHKPALEPGSVV
ncbi:hypothetical protein LZ554_007260 [Drepanopeziza brunnea f. sp. 'monogermtubi']|nr:hypothetical protein LZ554_007260 [Drepanopeziza brunnea f. sp. 'monogermtubi']